MAAEEPDLKSEGSLFSHLLELRNRLLYSVIGVLVFFIPAAIFSQDLYSLIAAPLMSVLPEGTTMIATEVASPFLTPLKLAFVVAIVFAIPVLLYQLWAFIAPGLYKHEQKMVFPLLFSSTFLFYCGMAFAYFVVFPLVFDFFTSVAPAGVQIMTDISSYLDFIFSMFLAFGIAFEVPVAVVLLVRGGIVDADKLAEKRPYVVLWAFVVAMLLTPPDVISQTLLAIPMLILFELGLFVARRTKKKADEYDEEDAHHEMTEAEMDQELDAVDKDSGKEV
jgi:sec-independent protein translocase protein TatC